MSLYLFCAMLRTPASNEALHATQSKVQVRCTACRWRLGPFHADKLFSTLQGRRMGLASGRDRFMYVGTQGDRPQHYSRLLHGVYM